MATLKDVGEKAAVSVSGASRAPSAKRGRHARICDKRRDWLSICAVTACLSFTGGSATAASPASPEEEENAAGGAATSAAQPRSDNAAARSPKELELAKALDENIDAFSFEETPLDDVINFIKLLPQFERVNFIVFPNDPVGNWPVTLAMNNVSLRTALTAMLRPRRLNFVIWSDAIFISAEAEIDRLRADVEASERRAQVQGRLQTQAALRTEAERKIEAALDENIEAFSFEETPLHEVINFLKTLKPFKKVNFAIDTARLMDREIFITLTMNDVSLRQALEMMLRPRGLDFAILNDAIFISTNEGIRERMPLELRTYDVRDLLGQLPGRDGTYGVNNLASIIFYVSGEDNWVAFDIYGQSVQFGSGKGWGNILEGGMMVVNQHAGVHDRIEAILEELRAAQPRLDEPAKEETPASPGRTGLRPGARAPRPVGPSAPVSIPEPRDSAR